LSIIASSYGQSPAKKPSQAEKAPAGSAIRSPCRRGDPEITAGIKVPEEVSL
jgi:hypothetical protein